MLPIDIIFFFCFKSSAADGHVCLLPWPEGHTGLSWEQSSALVVPP